MPAPSENPEVVTVDQKCRLCGEPFSVPKIDFPFAGAMSKIQSALRTCPKCEAEEIKRVGAEARARTEAERRQIELQRGEAARALWLEICPPLYQATDPARLPQRALAEVLAWHYGPEGLLLRGATGTGKTRAAFLLLNRLVLEERRGVRAFDGLGFEHECVRRFRGGTGEDWADELAEVDLVFLDDLGKGCFTPRAEAELCSLIERRAANNLPIIATTNMTGADLAAKATDDRGPPMVRRLREFCRCVVFEVNPDLS
jgi:DNA replication protein DnaC